MKKLLALLWLVVCCGSASGQVIDWTGTVTGSPSIAGNVPVTLTAGSYRVYFDINYNTSNPVDYGVNSTGGTGYVYTAGASLSYAWGNLTVGTGGVTNTWVPYENLPGGGYTMHVKVYQVVVTTKSYMGSAGQYKPVDETAFTGSWGSWSTPSTDFNSLLTLVGSNVVNGKVIQIETTGTSVELSSWRYRSLAYDPILPPPPPPGGGGGGSPHAGDFYVRTDADQCPVATAISDYTYQGRNYQGWYNLADPQDTYWRYTLDAVIAENPKYLFYGEVPFIGFYWYGSVRRKDCGGGGDDGHCCNCNCSECLTLAQIKEWGGETMLDTLKTSNTDLADKLYTKFQQSNDDLAGKIKDKLRDDASDTEKQSANDSLDLSSYGLQLGGAETNYVDPGSLPSPVEDRWEAVAQRWGWLKDWRPSQNGQLAFSVNMNNLPEGFPQLGVLEYSDRGDHPLRSFFDQLRPIIRGLASAGLWFCAFIHLGRYLTGGDS